MSSILTLRTKFARVVQRLEYYTDNVVVEGSIPSTRTKLSPYDHRDFHAASLDQSPVERRTAAGLIKIGM